MGIFSRLRDRAGGAAAGGIAGRLTGYCDLRGERLTGWVAHEFGLVSHRTHIQVIRRARLGVDRAVLASCLAVPNPRHRRFEFSLPVPGLISGEDLLKERVTITAVNEAGDSGDLRLDGSTQMELIRAHYDVPAISILDLDLSRGGNADGHLGAGWSVERDFAWTVDDESRVTFDSPAAPGTYVFRLTFGAAIVRPGAERQDMTLFLNDTLIGTSCRSEPFMQFEEFRFASALFEGVARSVLRLHHPDAYRPCDLGDSRDSRRLAFSFKRIWLVRLVAPDG